MSTGGTCVILFGILFWPKEGIRPNSFGFFHLKMIYPFFCIYFLALVLGSQLSLVITSAFLGIYNCQIFQMVRSLYNALLHVFFLFDGGGIFLLFRRNKRTFRCHIRIHWVARKMLEICTPVTLVVTMLWLVYSQVHFITKNSCLFIINLGKEWNILNNTHHELVLQNTLMKYNITFVCSQNELDFILTSEKNIDGNALW